jgi:hypothetical protein
LLDKIIKHKEALERGIILPFDDDDAEIMITEDSDLVEKEQLETEENDLKRRLKEQEDNLAEIMKEIEAKEKMLQEAIAENNKYLDMEEGVATEDGEISARTAAHKFSMARGKANKLQKGVNPDVPADKIIEELPEESDDEENNRLEELLEHAKHFNEEFDELQSSRDFYASHAESVRQLNDDLTDEDRKRALEYEDYNDSNAYSNEDHLEESKEESATLE